MPLSASQLATLKTDINASGDMNTIPNTVDGAFAIAALYNVAAAPDFWVWKTAVTKSEITGGTSVDGTTFTWVGNGFITRSAGEISAWNELFNSTHTVNAALPNVRQAFTDIFSGSGNAAANRTHLLATARRKATRVEKLFATGTGSTGSPAVMAVEGLLSFNDVQAARDLP